MWERSPLEPTHLEQHHPLPAVLGNPSKGGVKGRAYLEQEEGHVLGAGVCGGYRLGGHGVRDALGTIAGGVWTTSSRSWCLSLGAGGGGTENSDLF